METTKAIIARNTKNLKAMINGDIDAVRIAGVIISKVDVEGYKFHFRVGDGLQVYGEELEITESLILLKINGIICAFIHLGEA